MASRHKVSLDGASRPQGACPPPLSDWLAAGPYRLVLSSGFFGFFAHTGVLRALVEAGLPPASVSGASAGALVGGLWAGGASVDALWDALQRLRRQDFWDPGPGLGPLAQGRGEGLGPGWLRGGRFRRMLRALAPARTLGECPLPAAISTFDIVARRTRVLGSLESPEVELAAAIHASCAVPGMFQPVWIGGRPLWDGGVSDRNAMVGVRREERVLHHHLVSRSPWRIRPPRAPRREHLVALELVGLPRSGPFRLQAGVAAMHAAYRACQRALGTPVSAGEAPMRIPIASDA